MARETSVKKFLGIGPDEPLEERGVFPPPAPQQVSMAAKPAGADMPGPGEVFLQPEWLDADSLAHHFSADERLTAAIPEDGARALRLDAAPGVVLFEHIEAPMSSLGAVRHLGKRRWLMDSRTDEPAALVLPGGEHDLVVWGERGAVRVFALRSAR